MNQSNLSFSFSSFYSEPVCNCTIELKKVAVSLTGEYFGRHTAFVVLAIVNSVILWKLYVHKDRISKRYFKLIEYVTDITFGWVVIWGNVILFDLGGWYLVIAVFLLLIYVIFSLIFEKKLIYEHYKEIIKCWFKKH